MEIAQERLEREYGLDLIITAPTVVYRVGSRTASETRDHRPSDLPPAGDIDQVLEPRILAQITRHPSYLGAVLKLCQERRGIQRDLAVHGDSRAVVRYDLPLAEVVVDFYDRLKSSTRGYASMDYEFLDFRAGRSR